MKIASVADVKSQFSAFVKSSEGAPVVVTRNGRPVAVLVGVQDEEEIERLVLGYSARLRSILDKSRKQITEGRGLSHDEFWNDERESKPSKRPHKPRRKNP
jgi:prevent-host-death family protein